MSEHTEATPDTAVGDIAPVAAPTAAPVAAPVATAPVAAADTVAPPPSEAKEHEKTTDSPFGQLSKAAGTENVFGMFGGGSKKTAAPEEEENDRSGSSKSKAKAAEDVRPLRCSRARYIQLC
jgi:hypothetical protein